MVIAAALVALLAPWPAPAHAIGEAPSTTSLEVQQTDDGPVVTPLAEFGSGLAAGSAIGPDGALYVTEPERRQRCCSVDPQDRGHQHPTPRLPPQVLGVGGAMDVEFIGRTAYVLVTLVGGDIVGGGPMASDRRHLPSRPRRHASG